MREYHPLFYLVYCAMMPMTDGLIGQRPHILAEGETDKHLGKEYKNAGESRPILGTGVPNPSKRRPAE